MRKNCERCKYLSTDLYGAGVCQFFGDDLPSWADNENDGCLLRSQEVEKLIYLRDDVMYAPYNFPRDINGKRTDEEKKEVEKIYQDYDNYLKVVMDRCEKRKRKYEEN